jgi:DNA-binding GntR family transcriptional regulator
MTMAKPTPDMAHPRALAQTRLPTVRTTRMRDAIVDQLRELIVTGSLGPGSVLRQQELAERLGVSRTPLREALICLANEGLAEISPSGTTTVAQLSAQGAREAMQVREMVQGLVARLWANRGLPPPMRARLEAILGGMERSVAKNDRKSHQLGNAQFHLLLLSGLNMRWLEQFATLERLSSQATFHRLQQHPEHLGRSVGRHRALLQAIETRDADRAEDLARSHIREALKQWEAAADDGVVGPLEPPPITEPAVVAPKDPGRR